MEAGAGLQARAARPAFARFDKRPDAVVLDVRQPHPSLRANARAGPTPQAKPPQGDIMSISHLHFLTLLDAPPSVRSRCFRLTTV
jgi:hypothetical protein